MAEASTIPAGEETRDSVLNEVADAAQRFGQKWLRTHIWPWAMATARLIE